MQLYISGTSVCSQRHSTNGIAPRTARFSQIKQPTPRTGYSPRDSHHQTFVNLSFMGGVVEMKLANKQHNELTANGDNGPRIRTWILITQLAGYRTLYKVARNLFSETQSSSHTHTHVALHRDRWTWRLWRRAQPAVRAQRATQKQFGGLECVLGLRNTITRLAS